MAHVLKPWTKLIKPPRGGYTINWSHPRLRKIRHWYLFNEDGDYIYDLVLRKWLVTTNAPVWGIDEYGRKLNFTYNNDEVAVDSITTSEPLGFIADVTPLGNYTSPSRTYSPWYYSGAGNEMFFRYSGYVDAWQASMRGAYGSYQAITGSVTVTSNDQLNRRWVVGTNADGSTGIDLITVNDQGSDIDTTLGTTGTFTLPTPKMVTTFDGDCRQLRVYNRVVTLAECESVYTHPYLELGIPSFRLFFGPSAGGASYDESITLASSVDGPVTTNIDMGAAITLAAQAAQGDGTIATFNPLATFAASVGQTETNTATLDAISTLTAAVGTTWSEIVTKEGLLTLSAAVANPTTTVATFNTLAQLIATIAAPITGTNTLSETSTLSSAVGITWTDTLGEFIETLTMAVSAGMTPTEQADLVASLSLAMNTALTEQYTASVNALVSLGVSAAQAESAALALTEAITMGIQASLTNAGTVSSAAIGNLLKVLSEQIATPTVASEGLAISTHGESIDT